MTELQERLPSPDAGQQRAGAVLACMCACTLLVMGLVAAINIAVPMLSASTLHPGASQLLWIVDAYVIVFACLVIPGGAAGDRFGRKGALLTGLLTFTVGAGLSAVAPDVGVLLAGRVVTGIGAALVLPNCVGVLVHASAPERRKRNLAVWGAVSGMGGVVGNTIGGALLTSGSWRVLFAAVVPLALSCVVWVGVSVARSTRHERSLDPLGTGLLVAASVALLAGIIEGPERGWGSALVVTAFALGVALSVTWVVAELRTRHPLLDPQLFRIPAVASASLGMLVTFFGSFGLFYLNASLLQYGRGYSVLLSGVAILPLATPILVGARLVPSLVARIGIPVTLTIAFAAIGVGLFGLAWTARDSYVEYACWLLVVGVGFVLALPTLTAELTGAMPAAQAGVAGGLQAATREMGSALGIAVVGTVLAAIFVRHLPAVLAAHLPALRTAGQALAVAPGRHAAIVGAFTDGAVTALRVAGVVTLVAGALVVVGALRGRRAA
ncbi:MFS transporter [uncultured Jatrophihabitans sp.]|uniref:MFS transporter n=1 Tax=uncultured Jatrophihabitans sp. TaxID=1610747 RepID=UPI0035CC1498